MQKKLIALALASAFAAPAFAATSNVDIYGVFNASVERIDSDVAGKDTSTSVNNNSSRIGFKGAEDLGGGLAAIWQIETGFNSDGTQASSFATTRNTFIGLKGGFGSLMVGKIDTPMKGLGRAVDNFGDGIADSRNILGTTPTGANAWDQRTNNTIAYVTPNFSGLSATLAYVADTGTPFAATSTVSGDCAAGLDCNKRDAWSGAVNYNNGPLMVGAGYEKHNSFVGAAAPFADVSAHIWRVVAGYSFAGAKIGGLYEKASGDTGTTTVVNNGADRKAWGLFGNYAIGAVTLKANYLKADETNNVANSGAKQYTLGADYALSKRTTAYAFYAKVKNDSAASYGLGTAGTSNYSYGNLGVDPSVIGVGMKHSF